MACTWICPTEYYGFVVSAETSVMRVLHPSVVAEAGLRLLCTEVHEEHAVDVVYGLPLDRVCEAEATTQEDGSLQFFGAGISGKERLNVLNGLAMLAPFFLECGLPAPDKFSEMNGEIARVTAIDTDYYAKWDVVGPTRVQAAAEMKPYFEISGPGPHWNWHPRTSSACVTAADQDFVRAEE